MLLLFPLQIRAQATDGASPPCIRQIDIQFSLRGNFHPPEWATANIAPTVTTAEIHDVGTDVFRDTNFRATDRDIFVS